MNKIKKYDIAKIAVESEIEKLLSRLDYDARLLQAVRYSLSGGGKRLRPIMFLQALEMCETAWTDAALEFALSIECIHTYSLIHDDLPCMDDDDLRRGKPTCHKMYGEAIAVLAGDALLNLAYELLLSAIIKSGNKRSFIDAAAFLAKCAGGSGLISGQAVDIEIEQTNDELKLDYIYTHKTADLFMACMYCAGLISECKSKEILKSFGTNFGFAFQLYDDLTEYAEKTPQKKKDKPTYLSLNGLQKTKAKYSVYISSAKSTLKFLPEADISFFSKLIVELFK